jgi:hypothetical protein
MKRIGMIAEKHLGKDGRWRVSLKDDIAEYIGASVVNGTLPKSGRVDLRGDFPHNFARPGHLMHYFVFTDVCVSS